MKPSSFLNGYLEAPKLSNTQHEHSILGLYLCIFPIRIHVICKGREDIFDEKKMGEGRRKGGKRKTEKEKEE